MRLTHFTQGFGSCFAQLMEKSFSAKNAPANFQKGLF
jgi:hypothetical protein